MKAFLRYCEGKQYIWKDVDYNNGSFTLTNTGEIIGKTQIISIKDDNRNKFIRCSVCGKEFLKDSEEWLQHITKVNDTSKCFNCRYLRERNTGIARTTYTPIDEDRYEATRTYSTELVCTNSYRSIDIGSQDARDNCCYNRCVGAAPSTAIDIFTEYPGLFDDMATIKAVLKCGYKEIGTIQGETAFRLKGKNNIFAVVSNQQIVDHFHVTFRSNCWNVYYSSRYHRYYTTKYSGNGNYDYIEWTKPHQLTDETFEYIKVKIASIYK